MVMPLVPGGSGSNLDGTSGCPAGAGGIGPAFSSYAKPYACPIVVPRAHVVECSACINIGIISSTACSVWGSILVVFTVPVCINKENKFCSVFSGYQLV